MHADVKGQEELQAKLDAAGLGHLAGALLPLARPCIGLGLHSPSDKVGACKFGGTPDLAEGTAWPTGNGPLAFLCQINLADLAGHGAAVALPPRGFLWFFYDYDAQPWGFDPDDQSAWVVLFSDCAPDELRPQPAPEGLLHSFDDRELRPFTSLSFPPVFSNAMANALRDEPDLDSTCDALDDGVLTGGCAHQLLGLPDEIQDAMELQCQLTSHGINTGDPDGYEDSRVKELEEGAADWRLLLQIDSDEEGPGWMWGDTGMLYFWIREQDLANKRFDRVWTILQCH